MYAAEINFVLLFFITSKCITYRGNLSWPTNCLSVFNHFVKLTLRGLIKVFKQFKVSLKNSSFDYFAEIDEMLFEWGHFRKSLNSRASVWLPAWKHWFVNYPFMFSVSKAATRGLQVCNCIKKRLQHRCFPVNIAKFLRRTILKNSCKRLFLRFEPIWFHGFPKPAIMHDNFFV